MNTGAIEQKAGMETVDALLELETSLGSVRSLITESPVEVSVQETEPDHPTEETILGLWLYTPSGAVWDLRYSRINATTGVREWQSTTVV